MPCPNTLPARHTSRINPTHSFAPRSAHASTNQLAAQVSSSICRLAADACGTNIVTTSNGGIAPSSYAGHGMPCPYIVLVDADEGVHLTLDDDGTFEALPHPFAPKAISHAAHEALAA